MQQALLDQLRKITDEERRILDGEAEVTKISIHPAGILLWTVARCSRKAD